MNAYNKTSFAEFVIEARNLIFTHSLRCMDEIPPTQQALFQHVKRALLIAWLCMEAVSPQDTGYA